MNVAAARLMRKRLVTVGLVGVSVWLFYVVVANLFLATALEQAINRHPNKLLVSYRYAFTWWVGQVYVRDFHLSFTAPKVAFELDIDSATARVRLTDLLRRRFHLTHVRARGVSYRMFDKADPAAPATPRLLAYPHLQGVSPFVTERGGPPKSKAEIEKLWTVNLDDVDARYREVWILEYHWTGRGHATGSFALKPLSSLWVGPVEADMAHGELTVGKERISNDLSARFHLWVTPVEVVMTRKLSMLRGLQIDGRISARIDSLSFARVYGLVARGRGQLDVDAHIKNGTVEPHSDVTVTLGGVHSVLTKNGGGFEGDLTARAWLEEGRPHLSAVGGGALTVPLPDGGHTLAQAPRIGGEVRLTTSDFAEPWRLAWLDATVPELRIQDVTSLIAAFQHKLPAFAPALLGAGPLVARDLEGRGLPNQLHLHVGEAQVRETRAHGELEVEGHKASGAFVVQVAQLPVGIRIEQGRASLHFFPKPGWLEAQGRALKGAR
jgi:hypothetical protein